MKNILKEISLVLLLVFVFSSCEDDILDGQPLDAFAEETVFSDIQLVHSYVMGSYNAFPKLLGSRTYGTENMSDLTHYRRYDGYAESYHRFLRGELDPTNSEPAVDNKWSNNYKYLNRINSFFQEVESSPIEESKLTVYKAEMHFLRAWIYFDLLTCYGGVPIVTKKYELDDDFALNRNSINEVVEFIKSELDVAYPELPEDSSLKTRASKAAVLALRARLLTYAASKLFDSNYPSTSNWQAALDANKAVIDLDGYELETEYSDIFNEPMSSEIIFAREYIEGYRHWAILWPGSFGGWGEMTPSNDLVDMFQMANGLSIDDPESGYDPNNPYDNRDPRLYDIVLYNQAPFRNGIVEVWINEDDESDYGKDHSKNGANYTEAGTYFVKLTDKNSEDEIQFNPGIFFRMTEFYLNYAEALLELGREGEAKDIINIIRSRAGMPDMSGDLSGEALLEEYRQERAIELSLENHRWYDIRRWMIAPETYGDGTYGVDVLKTADGSFEYNTIKVAPRFPNGWDDKWYWFPIPDSEIKKSGETLDQNPGYN